MKNKYMILRARIKNIKPARLNFISHSGGDTDKIAREFLEKIYFSKNSRAIVVGLSGDLGVGKTAFTQAIGKHLGIKRKMASPTFVIMKKYEIQTPPNPPLGRGGQKHKFLFHLDAYRLKNEKELLHLGWEEIISNPEHLVLIEWPENVAKAIPKKHHKISIKHIDKNSREFKIK